MLDISLLQHLAAALSVPQTMEMVGHFSTPEFRMLRFCRSLINGSGYIFAGGDPLGGPVGVLRSTDNGDSWQSVNNGLTTGKRYQRAGCYA